MKKRLQKETKTKKTPMKQKKGKNKRINICKQKTPKFIANVLLILNLSDVVMVALIVDIK